MHARTEDVLATFQIACLGDEIKRGLAGVTAESGAKSFLKFFLCDGRPRAMYWHSACEHSHCASFFGKSEQKQIYPALFVMLNKILEP